MGFSLTTFFNDLFEVMNDMGTDEQDKLSALEFIINDSFAYAKECGQLKE